MIENAFLSTDGRFSHPSGSLPDECLFQRNKRGNEGFMMENDEIRERPRRTMEDLKAVRSTGTSS